MTQLVMLLAFAVAMSVAVSGFMIHAGLGDEPNSRSNHTKVTPTSGGVGLIAGVAGFFFLLPYVWPLEDLPQHLPKVLAALWAVAFLGLVDDVYVLPARLKFLILLGLSAIAVWVIGPVTQLPYALEPVTLPYVLGFAGSVLWVFVVTNAVNFMDGSNGLMPGVMIVACLVLAIICAGLEAGGAAIIPVALATALCGILPYNMRPKAHIFTGDVGSLLVGFGFAISVLWLCASVPEKLPVLIGPVLMLPFLTDVFLTLLWRARRKENLLEAHRTHLYQRLISAGHSHMKIAFIYMVATLLCGTYAFVLAGAGYHRFTVFLIFPVLILSLIYVIVSHRLTAKQG